MKGRGTSEALYVTPCATVLTRVHGTVNTYVNKRVNVWVTQPHTGV